MSDGDPRHALDSSSTGAEAPAPRRPSRRTAAATALLAASWRVEDPARYAYLLGVYLGDGVIVHKRPNTWTLRVSCDRAYPGIKGEISSAMALLFPQATPRERPYTTGAADLVSVTHPAIGRAFPQHGPGAKHRRSIRLADWQSEITTSRAAEFIRGLIHSDGCRCVNHFTSRLPSGRRAEYAYVRYFFSNLSADIRHLFRAHCELLGVRVTQPNHRNLSVSHRDSVAIMERIVGAKT